MQYTGWEQFEESRERILGLLERNYILSSGEFEQKDPDDIIIPVIRWKKDRNGRRIILLEPLQPEITTLIAKQMPEYNAVISRFDGGMGIIFLAAYSPEQTHWPERSGFSTTAKTQQPMGPTQILAFAMRRIAERQTDSKIVPDDQDIQQSPLLAALDNYSETGRIPHSPSITRRAFLAGLGSTALITATGGVLYIAAKHQQPKSELPTEIKSSGIRNAPIQFSYELPTSDKLDEYVNKVGLEILNHVEPFARNNNSMSFRSTDSTLATLLGIPPGKGEIILSIAPYTAQFQQGQGANTQSKDAVVFELLDFSLKDPHGVQRKVTGWEKSKEILRRDMAATEEHNIQGAYIGIGVKGEMIGNNNAFAFIVIDHATPNEF